MVVPDSVEIVPSRSALTQIQTSPSSKSRLKVSASKTLRTFRQGGGTSSTPVRHLGLQPLDDQRRNQSRDIAPKLKDALNKSRTHVGVLLSRHHEQSFEFRVELPVHHGHLKFILVVADRPYPAQNGLRSLLSSKINQKPIKR